jgi:hypothetical protein
MQRQIKFRGQRVDNKEWVYGCYIPGIYRDYSYIAHPTFHSKDIDFLKINNAFMIIPKTVGQFTGLLDKNNVEIYEGDIVKTDSGANQKVCWREDMAMFVLRFNQGASTNISADCEVIGNIHEHPHLLNKTNTI